MITIPLSKQGKHAGKYEAIVDDCDADLAQLNWHVVEYVSQNLFYSIRNIPNTHIKLRLHRVILSRKLGRPLDKRELVDHINMDGLDNRRENLRIATRTQNQMNRGHTRNNKTGYKGVCQSGKRYRAKIVANKKKFYLGTFDTPEQAHAAYCKAAKEHFGEFANEG